MGQKDLIHIEIISENVNFKIEGAQGGICSTCIARIKKGTVKMENNQILTEEEIKDGLTLTCQAIPASNSIIIDYDDV